ncbi:MAG: hypothetical protein Q9170_007728 [Blastenia crenularia]
MMHSRSTTSLVSSVGHRLPKGPSIKHNGPDSLDPSDTRAHEESVTGSITLRPKGYDDAVSSSCSPAQDSAAASPAGQPALSSDTAPTPATSCHETPGKTHPILLSSIAPTPDAASEEASLDKANRAATPELPTTYTEFKRFLVDNLERSGVIHYALNHHQLGDIPVMVYKGTTHSLRTSTFALYHQLTDDEEEKDLETYFRQIRHEGKVYKSWSEQHDSFLPLGRLVEPGGGDEAGRATNYVWAINVTTKPASFWLIYDYHREDELGFDDTINLREVYNNLLNVREDSPCTYQSLDSPFLGLEHWWDILKVFGNFASDWNPDDPYVLELGTGSKQPLTECLGESLRALTLEDVTWSS